MRGENPPLYEFGPFVLDVADHRLLRDGRPVPLTPKVFAVLRVLVEDSGHLVEKERVLAEVWPDSFVEEGALSRSVSVLRKVLGDGGSEKYIETVPKRGYRFVAPVIRHVPEVAVAEATQDAVTGDRVIRSDLTIKVPVIRQARRSVSWVSAAVVLLIAALVTTALERKVLRPAPSPAAVPSTEVRPLHRQVTFNGKEHAPAISPDGKRIAYVSDTRPEKTLIVQQLDGGPPLTIFAAPEINYPRWSPDGTELLVWARGAGRDGIYRLPQLGGTATRIAPGQYIACWSADGSTVAVASYLNGIIWFFNKLGQEQRRIALRDVKWSIWDIDWSVTDLLTFVSSDDRGQYTVWTVRPDGADQHRLVESNTEIPATRWTPHGDAVYYLRRLNQTFSLFKVSVPNDRPGSSSPVMVIAGLESDRAFALSRDGRRLVYARAPYYSNLWLAVPKNDGQIETRELTRGTSLVERPGVSPDGASVVFNIGHEPVTNLYTMPVAGGTPRQLTFVNSLKLEAVWSPDGNRIAFASTQGGKPRVWAVDAGGGMPHALSSADMSDTFDLTWSPGERILYQLPGNRNFNELDPETLAESPLVSDGSVGWMFWPVYSPDRRMIAVAWTRPPKRGIWVIDTVSHREVLAYPTSAAIDTPIGWSSDGRFVYVLEGRNLNFRGVTSPNGETATEARIVRVPVNSGRAQTVATLPFEEIGGVGMTPDGRSFVCVVYSSRSDVWIVDDFD